MRIRIQGVRYTAITTDSSGSFRVTGVDPGEYNLRFDKPGFVPVELPAFGKPRLRVGLSGTVRAGVEMPAMAGRLEATSTVRRPSLRPYLFRFEPDRAGAGTRSRCRKRGAAV